MRVVLTGILFCFIVNTFAQNTSELWGVAGELWDSTGRLPDFSCAGYHGGKDSIPNMAVVATVKDFGAKGDGVTDDLQAFKDAIDAADSGTILIPKGKYVLKGLLNLNKSNVVLRGEGSGEDGTVLHFTQTLTSFFGSSTTSPWLYGVGGLLWIGKTSGSFVGAKIVDVAGNSTRGSKKIYVADASGISAGQYIVLNMRDAGDHSLLFHLHNNQVDTSDYTVYPQTSLQWPVKVVSVNGNEIELEKYLRFDVKPEWTPAIYAFSPQVEESGIENLCVETPDQEYPGHHVDYGYNGFTFRNAFNCWAVDVSVRNAESAVDVNRSVNCEIRNLKIYGGTKVADTQDAEGTYGHHGISFSSGAADNLLTDFYIYDKYIHDITIQSLCNGNVIRRGIGYDIYFDHHKASPFENLFSDINTGLGTSIYQSSGQSSGPHSAARETFWNIKLQSGDKPYGISWGYIQENVIPADTTIKTVDREWYEEIDDIQPRELYMSQLSKRLGASVDTPVYMAPMIHPKPGIYAGEIEVSILSLNPEDVVRYTIDGTEPNSTSSIYNSSFTIDASAQDSFIVMAKVFESDVEVSPLAVSEYLKDTTPPNLVDYRIIDNKTIRLSFNEPIDTVTAEEIYNYYISYNNNVNYILVDSMEIYKVDAVILYLSQAFADGVNYEITVFNIEDLGGNVIDSDKSFINFNYAKMMITASTYQEGNPPENVLDKDLSTRWSAEGYDVWLMYDLGDVEEVYGVKIAFYKGNTRSTIFSISLSEDGENWNQVFDGQSSGNTTALETYSFIDTIDTRYVRINSRGNNSSNANEWPWNSYTELEVLMVDTGTTEPEPPLFIEHDFANSVKIYPNPLEGNTLYVDLNGYQDKSPTIVAYNVTGSIVYKKTSLFTKNNKMLKIQTDGLKSGIYIIYIKGENSVYTQKFVVK